MFLKASFLLAAAATASASSCFDEYQCIFHYIKGKPTDSNYVEFSWDFRPLCGQQDYNYTFYTKEGYLWTVMFNICGNTTYACNPNWKHSYSRGVAIQMWGNPPAGTTTDPETGLTVPYTPDCEVLGHTRPEFDLVDVNNPQNGGVILRHSSLPPMVTDKYVCPMNPLTGYPKERELDIVMQCDPGMPSNQLRPVAFIEIKDELNLGTCQYALTLASGAACGLTGDPYDSILGGGDVSGPGSPSDNFGYTVLGAFLCVVFQFGFSRSYSAGLLDAPLSKVGLGRYASSAGGAGFGKGKNSGFLSVPSAEVATAKPLGGSGGYGSYSGGGGYAAA